MPNTNTIVIIAIAVAFIIITVVVGLLVWYLWDTNRSSDRLSTPSDQMNVLTGPYPTYNAINGTVSSGTISESRYPQKDIYSRYGYRAVYTRSGVVVDRDKSSDIKWNDKVYKVMTFEEDEREISGFSFKIPKQKSSLIDSNIDYELVSNVYDNPDGSGTPLFKELIIGRVNSEASVLVVTESDDRTVNKILIS